jgi:hypothetical protein
LAQLENIPTSRALDVSSSYIPQVAIQIPLQTTVVSEPHSTVMKIISKAAQVGLICSLIIGPSIASIPNQGGWNRYCDKCMGATSKPTTVDNMNTELSKGKKDSLLNVPGVLEETDKIQTRKCKDFQEGTNCVKDIKLKNKSAINVVKTNGSVH